MAPKFLQRQIRCWRFCIFTAGEMPEDEGFQAGCRPDGQQAGLSNHSVGLTGPFRIFKAPVAVQKDGLLPELPVLLRPSLHPVPCGFHNGQMIAAAAQLQIKMKRQPLRLREFPEKTGVTAFAFSLACDKDPFPLVSCCWATRHVSQSGAGRHNGRPCTCDKSCRLAAPP